MLTRLSHPTASLSSLLLIWSVYFGLLKTGAEFGCGERQTNHKTAKAWSDMLWIQKLNYTIILNVPADHGTFQASCGLYTYPWSAIGLPW